MYNRHIEVQNVYIIYVNYKSFLDTDGKAEKKIKLCVKETKKNEKKSIRCRKKMAQKVVNQANIEDRSEN